ncbi:hypothetical protein LR48_Vigan543s001700 [Vigna angularis]|uniref:Uncharacterized protein n=1 Tax=Phaseolus angularis TaxID=3914 RepID=A0A0L9TE58_PHAAN|nr:hypothetical protein LR48_Vigan543s001700 [Vigna angularis]
MYREMRLRQQLTHFHVRLVWPLSADRNAVSLHRTSNCGSLTGRCTNKTERSSKAARPKSQTRPSVRPRSHPFPSHSEDRTSTTERQERASKLSLPGRSIDRATLQGLPHMIQPPAQHGAAPGVGGRPPGLEHGAAPGVGGHPPSLERGAASVHHCTVRQFSLLWFVGFSSVRPVHASSPSARPSSTRVKALNERLFSEVLCRKNPFHPDIFNQPIHLTRTPAVRLQQKSKLMNGATPVRLAGQCTEFGQTAPKGPGDVRTRPSVRPRSRPFLSHSEDRTSTAERQERASKLSLPGRSIDRATLQVAAAGRDSLSSKSGSVVLKDVPPSHDDIDDTLHDAAAKFDHSQLGDSSLVNQLQSNLTDNLVNSKLSHINPESELSSAKAAMEVSQHSSIETHEDISQNSDCSVAV